MILGGEKMTTQEVKISNRKDIILLLLYSPGNTKQFCEPILGRTRMTKLIYLFKKELYKECDFDKLIPKNKMHNFEPYKYGPFSIDVFKDLNFFENINFVKESNPENEEAPLADIEEFRRYLEEFIIDEEEIMQEIVFYKEVKFTLTEKGRTFAENLFKELTEKQQHALINFKSRYNASSLNALLTYVYKTYPEDTIKSEIREEIHGR